jgi:hypothetical protein
MESDVESEYMEEEARECSVSSPILFFILFICYHFVFFISLAVNSTPFSTLTSSSLVSPPYPQACALGTVDKDHSAGAGEGGLRLGPLSMTWKDSNSNIQKLGEPRSGIFRISDKIKEQWRNGRVF